MGDDAAQDDHRLDQKRHGCQFDALSRVIILAGRANASKSVTSASSKFVTRGTVLHDLCI